MSRCTHLHDDGRRCGQRIPGGTALCVWHDPARREEADALRRNGGRNSKPPRWKGRVVVLPEDAPPAPESIQDAKTWASWATLATATGRLDPDSARVIASLLREFVAAVQKSDHERELAELRAQLAELRGRT